MSASNFRNLRKTLFFGVIPVLFAGSLLACSALLGDFEVGAGSGGQAADTGPGSGNDSGPNGDDGGPKIDTGLPPVGDAGDAGDAGPRTYCDDFVPPPGSVQSLCADFDSPLLNKNWDNVSRTDGGVLEKTTDVAVSMPNALLTGVSGGPTEATLLWKRPGAKEFEEVTARVQINPAVLSGVVPPANPLLELIDIRTSNSSVTFGYSRGSTSLGGGAAYYGWYVTNAVFGGAAALTNYKITTALAANVWTDLKITWGRDGKINVTYNGISVLAVAGYASSDTVVNVRLGAQVDANVGVMPLTRFDNAEFSIRRVN